MNGCIGHYVEQCEDYPVTTHQNSTDGRDKTMEDKLYNSPNISYSKE